MPNTSAVMRYPDRQRLVVWWCSTTPNRHEVRVPPLATLAHMCTSEVGYPGKPPTAGDCSKRTRRVAPSIVSRCREPHLTSALAQRTTPLPFAYAHCHDCLCARGWTCVCTRHVESAAEYGKQAPHRAAPQPLRELAMCCVRSCADCCVHARTPSSHPDGSGRDNRPHLPRPTPVPCRSDEASIRQPASLASPRFPMPSYRGPDGASCDGMSPSCDAFAWRV